ncbi:MAG: HAD-IA family hydrolase [Planctomycetota bacterium]
MTNTQWWTADFTGRYTGLIFDCDGTLTDSMPLHYIAWRNTMARYGIRFSQERFYQMGGMPTEKIIATLSQEQGVSVDPVAASRAKETAFESKLHQVKSKPDVVTVAKNHVGRVKMAVASGSDRAGVELQLQAIGVVDYFPVVVTSEDTTRHKPEPDVFLLAAARMNVPANSCLVFEDSPLGMDAAQRAGMDCIDVRFGRLHTA